MIIRGGENIACPEVEGALHQIEGILEASVFSIPHERLGEAVGAAVYASATPSLFELQAALEQTLARFKIPEKIWFYPEPLPRGATEKIDKRGIREACLGGAVASCGPSDN
jgi:acyl-CoA synthetase (AMP-forming)/AMP-acid ligase II